MSKKFYESLATKRIRITNKNTSAIVHTVNSSQLLWKYENIHIYAHIYTPEIIIDVINKYI